MACRILSSSLLSLLLLAPLNTAAQERPAPLTDIDRCRQALTRAPTDSAPPLPSILRLASWNIMKELRQGADEELANLRQKNHFLLLQEALAQPSSAPRKPINYYFAAGIRRGDTLTGVGTYSHLKADLQCALSFREPWLRTPKAALVLRIPAADGALLLINLHGINFTLGSAAYRTQLMALGNLVDLHKGPAIIAGDFNHWNPWRRGVLEDFRRDYGLTEMRFAPDWRSRHLGSAVDTVLYRGLNPVIATAVPSRRSDHHALLGRLATHPKVDDPAPGGAPAQRH